MNDKYRLTVLPAALAAAMAAAPLSAQERAGDAAVLEEVIVTARKQQERLLDVPLAITALTAQAIEERGIRNLHDVAANTPGLTFSSVEGEFLPAPVIRGMAPINILGETNTAIFIDGVYVSGREGLNFSQLDLERIEVIKGPQAALYGRNSFSGTINYVTAKPTDELRGRAEVTLGNDERMLGSLSLSGPIREGTLKGRIALLYDDFGGSYENPLAGGPDIGGYRFKTAQGTLLFTPAGSFEGELSLYVSDDRIDNSAITAVAANCENLLDLQPPPPRASSRNQNFCGEFPAMDEHAFAVIPQATGEERDLRRAHLRLEWQTGAGALTALSGYSFVEQSYFLDGSRAAGETVPFTYLAAPLGNFRGFRSGVRRQFQTGLLQFGPGDETEELSQEIRFSSPVEDRFRYSIGAHYYETASRAYENGLIGTQPLPADFGSFCFACVAVGPGVFADFVPVAIGDQALLAWFTDPTGGIHPATRFKKTIEAPAVFGYVELDFADRWTGRIEARYTDEERGFDNFDGSTGERHAARESWGLVNWRATLRFEPAESWTLYGSVAHAEKGGDFDSKAVNFLSAPSVDVFVPGAFDPEENLSYELGLKAELFERRLGLEADVFYIDWSDIVIPQVLSAIDGQPLALETSFRVNAGDARVQGVELAVIAQPAERFDVHAGVAWIDAEYDDARVESFRQYPSFAPFGDISGNRILRMSEWQANAGVGYSAPLPRGAAAWFVRSDLAYRGEQFADATNQAIIPAQTLVNASLGLRGERWTLELWGRNLGDEDEPIAAYRDAFFSNTTPDGTSTSGTFFAPRYSVSYPRLRTYGLTWRMRF